MGNLREDLVSHMWTYMNAYWSRRLQEAAWDFMAAGGQKMPEQLWGKPLVRFAAASDPLFASLKERVVVGHHVPQDYLPSAATVLSYFVPILRPIAASNQGGRGASPLWALVYLETNKLAGLLNQELTGWFASRGVKAVVPWDEGKVSHELPKSRWSQRHVAYIAGQGTFGLNNMLISDQGAVGRYFSLVTDLQIPPDPRVTEERCLYKKNGSCGLCVQRCFTGALTREGFDRFRCQAQLDTQRAHFQGAGVCGKCVVELPCSHGTW